MIILLIIIPILAGFLSFLIRSDRWRRALLVATALSHTILVIASWQWTPPPVLNGWLQLDALGRLFLSITSMLFLFIACYGVGYMTSEPHHKRRDLQEGMFFINVPEAIFSGCLLLFLASMTLVTLSHNFGILWIALEASTLASAPLIYFHKHHRSLEATWKYLMVCSVGIGLALIGNFLLTLAATGLESSLDLADLIQAGTQLQASYVKGAFLFFLVGYGTKMGLAPLHTWLPDAHSEAPSMVSALLSGALLNCAFLAILRAFQVCIAAGEADFCGHLLIGFGLFSMVVAAIFIVGQTDYKRMLAYSSVEHMGILALGIGLGGSAIFGAMLHAVNHALLKAMLFMVSGHILALYQTKLVSGVRGILHGQPLLGILWLTGFLAITGAPPFGMFISELTILKAAIDQGHFLIAVIYLGLLSVIFIGMSQAVLGMVQGKQIRSPEALEHLPVATWRLRRYRLMMMPAAVLAMMSLLLGLVIPTGLERLLHMTASALAGGGLP